MLQRGGCGSESGLRDVIRPCRRTRNPLQYKRSPLDSNTPRKPQQNTGFRSGALQILCTLSRIPPWNRGYKPSSRYGQDCPVT